MSDNIVGSVKSTELEVNLGRTLMGRPEYIKVIDAYLMNNFSNTGENVFLPTVDYVTDVLSTELRQEFVNLYNAHMGTVKGVENIPDELKVLQGALFDGLCYGYDVNTGKFAIYTMNLNLLVVKGMLEIPSMSTDLLKTVMAKNKVGEVKCYRIDIEYEYSSEVFSFKAVNHRTKMVEVGDDIQILLIPYIAGVRLMKMLESIINSGKVVKTVQMVNNVVKTRCITINMNVLKEYSGQELLYDYVKPTYFPLKGFFYAPVVGASSLTAGVTNINIFDLCEIKRVSSIKALEKLGIEKCSNAIRKLCRESVIGAELMSLKSQDLDGYLDLVASLPSIDKVVETTDDMVALTTVGISKYLHSITEKEQVDVESILNLKSKIDERERLFNVSSEGYVFRDDLSNLQNELKRGIFKILSRSKSGKLTSVVCTNSRSILTKVYGIGYFSKYEGFSARFYAFLRDVQSGTTLTDALGVNGLIPEEGISREDRKKMLELIGKISPENDTYEKELKTLVGALNNARVSNRSGSSDSIVVRSLDAYIDSEGTVHDYYRYVNPSEIISCKKLGE